MKNTRKNRKILNNHTIKKNNNKKNKKNKKLIQAKTNTQKGGFLFTDAAEKYMLENGINDKNKFYNIVINEYIKKSKKKLISYSSLYGLIISMTLNDDIIQKFNGYMFMDTSGNIIKTFLLKLSFINDNPIKIDIQGINSPKMTVTEYEFTEEVKLHKKIFIKSINAYGKSIVPEVFLGGQTIFSLNDETYKNISVDDKNKQMILEGYLNAAIKQNINIVGIYIMKYTEGYITYYDNVEKYAGNQQIINELNEIYRTYHILFGLLGYVHKDAHGGNIMIDFDNRDAFIIDFGRIEKIQLDCYDKTYRFSLKHDILASELLRYITVIIKYINNKCDEVRIKLNKKNNVKIYEGLPCQNIAKWYSLTIDEVYNLYNYIFNTLIFFNENYYINKKEILKRLPYIN